MEQDLDLCKKCVEYGSEFCEECLKDRKKEKANTQGQELDSPGVKDELNNT